MRLNRKLALLSIAIIFFYCVNDNVYAKESFKVGTNSLNVRTEPFIQADVIGSLPKGTQVNVLELKHDWAKIQYQGKIGWIASHYLYSSASASIESDKSIAVAAQGVRLRSGPGTDYSIVGYTTYGETFQLIESKGDWKHVRLNNGNSAWIAGWLVSADGQVPTQPKKSLNKVGNLSGKTIILDAGHGGYDPGAVGVGGVLEKDLNDRTSQIVKKKLQSAGAEVIMTRSGDRYVDLQNRINLSLAYPSAIFISIHHNAHKNSAAHGINTFYFHPSDEQLSSAIQEQLANQTPLRGNGVRFGDYFVLRNNHQHAILIELGFITNPNDIRAIQSESYQNQVADSIVQGLINYLDS